MRVQCWRLYADKRLGGRIVCALVDFPEEVDVQEVGGTNMKLLEIKVSKKDVGRLLGKKGGNITALRTIVSAAGKGKRYVVDAVEEESSEP